MKFKWDDLRLFLAVYEQGSLSGAARALKLGQPTLSRRMGDLEDLIGEPLLLRQAQGVCLTEAGQKLLLSAQRMADWAMEAEMAVGPTQRVAAGKVRIAAPPGLAHAWVAPMAAQLRKKHPTIQLEVLSGVETLNLARGEADLSLRTSQPTDADLHCLDHACSPVRVYVSPDYARGLPKRYALADLDWICWAPPYDQQRSNTALKSLIPNFKPAFTSDDFNVQAAACRSGVGAMMMAQALQRQVPSPELVSLPCDLGPDAWTHLYLVCHKRHRHLPRVQRVVDFMAQEFKHLRDLSPQ